MGQARSFLTLGGSFFGDQRVGLRVGLCGIGPALAGNVGTGGAFARLREGDQGVDVPMLAPDLSRCRPGVLSGGGGSILGGDEGGVLRREMMDCVVGGALRDRSCARRERWDRRRFRAVARGGIRVSTFLCSLRTYPAAAQGCCLGAVGRFWEGMREGF
jgi:hypothetical protein